jgi:hypothetical protein
MRAVYTSSHGVRPGWEILIEIYANYRGQYEELRLS